MCPQPVRGYCSISNFCVKLIEKCVRKVDREMFFFAKLLLMWKLFQRRKRVEVRLSAGWWIGRWPLEWSIKDIFIYIFIRLSFLTFFDNRGEIKSAATIIDWQSDKRFAFTKLQFGIRQQYMYLVVIWPQIAQNLWQQSRTWSGGVQHV